MSSQLNLTENAYNIQKVSKELEIPTGTIRQWEKDFSLNIPRDSITGARVFTNYNLLVLQTIKSYRENNLHKREIKDLLIKEGLIKEETASENQREENILSNFTLKELLMELSKPERLVQASDEEYKLFLSLVKSIENIRQSTKDINHILSSFTEED